MRVLTALAAIALPVLACECRRLSVCELIQMPTVFIGEVIDGGVTSIRDDPWHSNVNHVRFRVLENFRGLPPKAQTVDVELTPTSGMCAPIPYFPGRRYLVIPRKREGKYTDGVCFQGRDIETAQDEVRQLRGRDAQIPDSWIHDPYSPSRRAEDGRSKAKRFPRS